MSVEKEFQELKINIKAILFATNNFNEEKHLIGEGGFGKVYKGELPLSKGHTMEVAVKRLNCNSNSGQGDREFWTEVRMLSLYKHENIVSLIGFCIDDGERILVYEYASNKSLDLQLDNNDLTWAQRLNICIGAARGLAYLHSDIGTKERVLHRDIKSANILLDENWNAKIADLGLSKFGPVNNKYSTLFSNAVGTLGYCDPVYANGGLLTKEADVYSFGVVFFEVLCGRLYFGNNGEGQTFTNLVEECYKHNRLKEIVYVGIKDEINPSSLNAFTEIAYQCLKNDRKERPPMKKIVKALEDALRYQIYFTNNVNTLRVEINPGQPAMKGTTDVNPSTPLKKIAKSGNEGKKGAQKANQQLNNQFNNLQIDDRGKNNKFNGWVGGGNNKHQQQGKGVVPQEQIKQPKKLQGFQDSNLGSYAYNGFPISGNGGGGSTQKQVKQPNKVKGVQDSSYYAFDGFPISGNGGGGSSSRKDAQKSVMFNVSESDDDEDDDYYGFEDHVI